MSKTVPQRSLAGILASVALLALTACEGDTPTDALATEVKKIEYRDETLTCFVTGAGTGADMTCDFDAFYLDNPSLVEYHERGEEPNVKWLDVKDSTIACVYQGKGDSATLACDWHRFYLAERAAVQREV